MEKLLIINRTLSFDNGIGKYSIGLINELKKFYDLTILSSELDNTVCRDEKNVKYYKIASTGALFNPLYVFVYFWKLRKFFKTADFIHSFSDYPHSFLAALAAKLSKKTLFLSAIGTYSIEPFNLWLHKYFHRFALRRAKKIVCISRFTEKELKKRINLTNTVVINCGVDFKKFAEFSLSSPAEPREDKIIVSTGTLKARKGYDVSIPAIKKVKEKYQNIKYYIVGSRPDKAQFNRFKNLAKECGLEKYVVFLEKISDTELIKLYYSADLFLLPSINIKDNFEGFGLVYLEAGACAKPVIGTYNCGAEDAIVDGVTGLLVPQNNIEKTAEAILKLLDNPELARKMGENGRKRAQEMDWANIVKKYIGIYENNL